MAEPARLGSQGRIELSETKGRQIPFLKTVPREALYETLISFVVFVLGFSLSARLLTGFVVACVRFALPHWVTGQLVKQSDPDKQHGRTLRLLYFAQGLFNAFIASVAVLFVFMLCIFFLNPDKAWNEFISEHFLRSMVLAVAFLSPIFPITVFAALSARKIGYQVLFIPELTGLRRHSDSLRSREYFYPRRGLRRIAIASAASAALWTVAVSVIVTGFVLEVVGNARKELSVPEIITLTAAMAAGYIFPLIWYCYLAGTLVDKNPTRI